MTTLVCSHEKRSDAGRLCHHLIADEDLSYVLRFTGRGVELEYVCEPCSEAASCELEPVCEACLADRCGSVFDAVRIAGAPEVRSLATSLRFEHRELVVPELAIAPLHAIAPLTDPKSDQRSLWLGVNRRAELVRIDLDACTVEPLAQVPPGLIDQSIALVPSPCACFVAIVERHGQHGVIIDLAAARASMLLDRNNYCVEVSDFSIAFVRDRDRTLVIHATDWNRLDISDPQTGELLTTRTTGPDAPRDLNYFHAGLTVSPDGRWLIDDGWVWAPVGCLEAVDLQRWIHENLWETEDSAGHVRLREVGYFWDGPRCFTPDNRLIVGGFGPDDQLMVDAAQLFDPATGELLRWFAGPPRKGTFVFDRWLFASEQQHGTSVWDIATGERLCHDPGLMPASYHPGPRCFVSLGAAGAVRSSVLVDPMMRR